MLCAVSRVFLGSWHGVPYECWAIAMVFRVVARVLLLFCYVFLGSLFLIKGVQYEMIISKDFVLVLRKTSRPAYWDLKVCEGIYGVIWFA